METIKITGKNGTLKGLIHEITFSKIIAKFNMKVQVYLSGKTVITIEENFKDKPNELEIKQLDSILKVYKKSVNLKD